MKIYDCRRKEILNINRRGGDIEILITDLEGKVIFKSWYQMKKPNKETYIKIEKVFLEFKNLLERQEDGY